MTLIPVEEYARKMGEKFVRVLSWFKRMKLFDKKVFVETNYVKAVREYCPESLRDYYVDKCLGFCARENGERVIAINIKKCEKTNFPPVRVFAHELAHATWIEDYYENRVTKSNTKMNEEWAEAVESYLDKILKIEKQTGKIRRNPFRILRFTLTRIVKRIEKFTRKKIARKYRREIREIVRETLEVWKENLGWTGENDFVENILILQLITEITFLMILNEDYKTARRFLTYLLYMK